MKKNKTQIHVSVVIPCYNEEKIISSTYERIKSKLEELGCNYEILLGSDGSTDGTNELINQIGLEDKHVEIIILDQNRGMGYMLRKLFEGSKGDVIIQMDADLSTGEEVISTLLHEIKTYDVVILHLILFLATDSHR